MAGLAVDLGVSLVGELHRRLGGRHALGGFDLSVSRASPAWTMGEPTKPTSEAHIEHETNAFLIPHTSFKKNLSLRVYGQPGQPVKVYAPEKTEDLPS